MRVTLFGSNPSMPFQDGAILLDPPAGPDKGPGALFAVLIHLDGVAGDHPVGGGGGSTTTAGGGGGGPGAYAPLRHFCSSSSS